MLDLHWYPGNLYLINSVENNVDFLDLTEFNSDNSYKFSCRRNAQVTFVEKPHCKSSVLNIINIDN